MEIHADGGGDEPESGLEALYLAMLSDFAQDGGSRRHVIVLFTNSEAHAFEDYNRLVEEAAKKGCKPEMYPENMPKDLSEFCNEWQGNVMKAAMLGSKSIILDRCGRRLVLFAPKAYPWIDMEVELENTIRIEIEHLKNYSDFPFEGFLFD